MVGSLSVRIRWGTLRCLLSLLLPLMLLVACGNEPTKPPPAAPPPAPPAPVVIAPAMLTAFGPLPARMDVGAAPSAELISLGRMLYYEPRFSKSGTISCNTCHDLNRAGQDGLARSLGHDGKPGGRNSPTTLNAAGHLAQFWDGRAADVEAQAKGPVLNPVEMGMPDAKAVEKVLKGIPGYVDAFKAAFPDQKNPVTFDNVAIAVGAFERGLTTPAAWDALLAGNQKALTDDQKKGFQTFVSAGCPACHTGVYVGGSMYQKLGLVTPWPDTADLGRFQVTNNEADKMMFKVPSLRNVTKTAPYFHDGSIATLDDAIQKMGVHQLGKQLSPAEVASIKTWLGSLEGTPNADYVKKPELPGLASAK